MDDKTNMSQTLSNQSNQTNQVPPVQPVQDQVVAEPIVQDSPVSSAVKEQEPIPYVKKSETEPIIDQELKEAGLESKVETPKLTEEHEKIGIRHAKESVPIVQETKATVQLPMTMSQIKKITQVHKKVSDSILWFALLVLRQIKKDKRNNQ